MQVSLEKVGYIAVLAPVVKVGAVDLVKLRKDLLWFDGSSEKLNRNLSDHLGFISPTYFYGCHDKKLDRWNETWNKMV